MEHRAWRCGEEVETLRAAAPRPIPRCFGGVVYQACRVLDVCVASEVRLGRLYAVPYVLADFSTS
jgi:hypothetical protein